MNDTNTNKRLSPRHVITVYSDKNKNNFYLENREVRVVGDKPTLMEPVPMPNDVLLDVAKSYLKTTSAEMDWGGFIAGHLLYGVNKPGKTIVMWYRPEMKRSLNFSTALKINDAPVMVPPTLYVLLNNNLYVYALMEGQRPDLKTKVYKAPFFNIYDDGRVCMGTAHTGRLKAKTYEGEAERYERAFYLAEQNGGTSTNNCKTPLNQLWPKLIKSKGPFPVKDELKEHASYKTVADLLQKLIRDNSNHHD